MSPLCLLLASALLLGDEPEVHVELQASTLHIAPGESFELAVLLKYEPGWHIYWKNPGDSGFATTAQLSAPPGFTVEEVRYPAPVSFKQAGDLTCYGYEESACLFMKLTAPEELKGDEFSFTAAVQYLICDEVCFSGEVEVQSKLRRETSAADTSEGYSAEVRAHVERLPRPLLSSWKKAHAKLSGPQKTPTLSLWLPDNSQPDGAKIKAMTASLFPAPLPGLSLGTPVIKRGAGGLEISVPCSFKAQKKQPAPATEGVLSVKTESGELLHLSFTAEWRAPANPN
jgi:DsbC/DsbD-like thiol-disulfide interchange protein